HYAMIHQPRQQFFERATAEFSQCIPYSFGGNLSWLARAGIQKLTPLHLVPHVLFRFQAAKNCSNGGISQRTFFTNCRPDRLAGSRTVRPEEIHHLLFEFAESFLSLHFERDSR